MGFNLQGCSKLYFAKFPVRYRKKLRTFYLILGLFTILISSLLFKYAFQFISLPYKCKIENTLIFPEDNKVEVYYHDFDHNGFSEHLQFKFIPNDRQIGVKYYNDQGNLIDQWNFPEQWLRKAVFFADYDNDNFDEAYFFTMAHDSLFLYGFDPRELNQFFLWRQFIAAAPSPNPHPQKIWDIFNTNCLFLNSDEDPHKECYILLMAGFSLQPRGMLRFDIDQRKITARSPFFGAVVANPVLIDLNNDGKKEILLRNSLPPDNYHYDVPYRDNQCYLMVFDQNLNFFFKPIAFPHVRAGLSSIPWKVNGKTYIVSVYRYDGPLNVNDKLYLFDSKGNELRHKVFPKKSLREIYTLNLNGRQHLFVINRMDGRTIYELNENLEIVDQFKVSMILGAILGRFDLNGDLKDEFLTKSSSLGYLIFNPEERFCIPIPQVKYNPTNIHSFNQRGGNGGYLVIQQGKNIYQIAYLPTLWYPVRHLIFILLSFLIYLFLLEGYLLWQTITARYQTWKALISSASSGLCILNLHGKIKFLNGNFERFLNFPNHLNEGRYFADELEENQALVKFIEKLIDTRKFTEKEIKNNQDSQTLLLRGRVLSGMFGLPAGFMVEAIPHHVTIYDNKLMVWLRSVQKMAHDIKTPLAAVQFLVQSLKLQLKQLNFKKMDQLNPDFDTIEQELTRIKEMTKNLLRFTNLEKPNFQWISIKESLNSVLRKLPSGKDSGLKINLDLDPNFDRIWADPVLVEMALQAVIENAIEALQGEGIILISNALIQKPEENFRSYIEIEITDNGPGISDEIKKKIFEPFFTTKEEGTGMGLPLARKIMEDHDGQIEIQSQEGKYTRVRLLFPFREVSNG